MNWNTFGGAISVSKILAWQIEPRSLGLAPKIYHSSNPPQPSGQQQLGGSIATDSNRGLYAIPPLSLHPAARSSPEGLKEPLSNAVIAMCLLTSVPGQSDKNSRRSW